MPKIQMYTTHGNSFNNAEWAWPPQKLLSSRLSCGFTDCKWWNGLGGVCVNISYKIHVTQTLVSLQYCCVPSDATYMHFVWHLCVPLTSGADCRHSCNQGWHRSHEEWAFAKAQSNFYATSDQHASPEAAVCNNSAVASFFAKPWIIKEVCVG